MIKITTILLFFLLGLSAVGRYQAETSVRQTQADLVELDLDRIEEERAIKVLRAEIAYLENPERLAKIASATTDLRPTAAHQSHDAREFAALLGGAELVDDEPRTDPSRDFIGDALAMAQLSAAP
ncbi:MAG: hypothetical protein AAGC77_00125 [Pseudomonadota bacterium]